jgi:hypothetical protein
VVAYWNKPGLVKIMRSIAMFLLTIDPTYFLKDLGFGILDFGFKVFCQFNKNR